MKALTWQGKRDIAYGDVPTGGTYVGRRLGVDEFATHRLPLSDGPAAYEMFQKKQNGAVKVLLTP